MSVQVLTSTPSTSRPTKAHPHPWRFPRGLGHGNTTNVGGGP